MSGELSSTSLVNKAIKTWEEEGTIALVIKTYHYISMRTGKKLFLFYYILIDWISGRRARLSFDTTGKYTIKPAVSYFPEFEFYFDFYSPHVRRRLLGDYETDVVKEMADILNENSNFWEVGAAWGYHSLMVSQIVNQVVSFEPMEERRKLLERSSNENNFQNISTVPDNVQSLDDYLNNFDNPDVILVDIEGWEYEVLPSSPQLLLSECIWIVELHHNVDAPPAKDSTSDEIETLFREHNYDVEIIQKRGSLNWRGKEDDSLNTHHIIARPK